MHHSTPGGGTLYSDQAIAGGTNNSTDNSRPVLVVTDLDAGGGVGTDFFYTLYSSPSLEINGTDIVAGITAIEISVVSTYGFVEGGAMLTYGGSPESADGFTVEATGMMEMGDEYFRYTWTWGVAGEVIPSSYSVSLGTLSGTEQFVSEVSVTQVPEPESFAILFGIISCGFCALRRRRRTESVA